MIGITCDSSGMDSLEPLPLWPPSTPDMHSVPPILRLPLELRQQIYAYLITQENVSHPIISVGITSVTHRAPPKGLLYIHRQLMEEVLDYFYSIATWKLIFSHAFNFFRIDPYLKKLEGSAALKRMRKVEIVFFCDILLLREYPSFGLESFCAEIRRRCDRACDVLAQAPSLSSVTVSWIDTTLTGGWKEKATILSPLRKLSVGGNVTFWIGEINGPDDLDRGTFVRAMKDALGVGSRLKAECDVSGALDGSPSGLRMLAFDPRQARQRLHDGRKYATNCNQCSGEASPSPLQEASASDSGYCRSWA